MLIITGSANLSPNSLDSCWENIVAIQCKRGDAIALKFEQNHADLVTQATEIKKEIITPNGFGGQ